MAAGLHILNLKLLLPLRNLIPPHAPHLEGRSGVQRILHKLHVRDLLLHHFGPDTKRARARLAQRAGPIRKTAEDGDVFSSGTEEGEDLEILLRPDFADRGEGVEDCEGPFVGVGACVGEDLLEGWVAVVKGDVGRVGCDEGLEGCEGGGIGEEGSDDFDWG